MTNRRNPFEATPASATPPSIFDSLRVAAPRQRNRQWETNHQEQKVVYRGVDPKLAMQVKTIAGKLTVPEGEVARALIEHALHAYAEGDLDLSSRPDPDRMRRTLFRPSTSSPGSKTSGKPGQRRHAEASWRVITTWRGFPLQLKQEITALASPDGLDVPVGELVSALLRYGLEAHKTGLLELESVEQVTRRTLAHGDHS